MLWRPTAGDSGQDVVVVAEVPVPDTAGPAAGSGAPRVLSRRTFLRAAAVVGGVAGVAGATPLLRQEARSSRAPGQRVARPLTTWGVQSGDVTHTSGIVWSRTDRPARMLVEVAATESFRRLRGSWTVDVGPDTDFTGKVKLQGLPPGTELFYRVQFADLGEAGTSSRPLVGSLRTAPAHRRDVTFVWSGDVGGQGYGINLDTGGMTGFEAVRTLDPDFFIHSGDSVYADEPLQERLVLADGSVWTNLLTPEKVKVAETLSDYRGQYRYNLLDENVRRFAAQVPQFVQWDDHEVTNNWYPGEVLGTTGNDSRYTVKDVDTLASRARRAFLEYMPLAGDRIDRALPYGPLVEVFALDLRSYRGPNSLDPETEKAGIPILGQDQVTRLTERLVRSRALWKVIASDMPLGLVLRDRTAKLEGIGNLDSGQPSGRELELARLLAELQRRSVRNVVWLTADVHYTAAHFYDPDKAAFAHFDPFWEFVAGPLHAGTFLADELDGTFGPRVVFSRAADRSAQPPTDGLQFLGHVRIDGGSGVMTVELRDVAGNVLHTQDLTPVPTAQGPSDET